jgi:hypothetical protein
MVAFKMYNASSWIKLMRKLSIQPGLPLLLVWMALQPARLFPYKNNPNCSLFQLWRNCVNVQNLTSQSSQVPPFYRMEVNCLDPCVVQNLRWTSYFEKLVARHGGNNENSVDVKQGAQHFPRLLVNVLAVVHCEHPDLYETLQNRQSATPRKRSRCSGQNDWTTNPREESTSAVGSLGLIPTNHSYGVTQLLDHFLQRHFPRVFVERHVQLRVFEIDTKHMIKHAHQIWNFDSLQHRQQFLFFLF